MKRALFPCSLLLLVLVAGCGGGSSGSPAITQTNVDLVIGDPGGSGGAPSLRRGIFTDSPVAGVRYRTETVSGTTDADGGFSYLSGETVTFSIGDLVIGSARAKAKVTPVDLTLQSDLCPKTINIARFLQSLDKDGNLNNGIQIDAGVAAELAGRTIDFGKSVDAFNDTDMQGLFSALNARHLFTDGERSLIGPISAQYNFRSSQEPGKGPFDGDRWTSYTHEETISSGSGVIISTGNYDPPPDIIQVSMEDASLKISGSSVTFSSSEGGDSTGTIAPDGTITMADAVTTCKDGFGNRISLSSRFVLRYDGTIKADWSVLKPAPWPGYCYTESRSVVFGPPLDLTSVIIFPSTEVNIGN